MTTLPLVHLFYFPFTLDYTASQRDRCLRIIEENSGLGKAISYFLKHYAGLSLFCYYEGVKLDNNRIEAMLKIVVRDRKNAMFHKTLLGATIGDVITSMIATGSEAGINVFDYFTRLQRDAASAKKHPEKYLPWNYLENN